jgi:hypothetical protein
MQSKKPTNRFIITDFNRCKGEPMNSIEFAKPENWSIGKRTGFLSIMLLIFGPMILFFMGSIIRSYSLFVAVVTIVLLITLLYTNTNIFLERGGTQRKINHFIIMVWGAWQFYSYFGLVAYYMTYPYTHFPYTLITGLWLTVIGFLLCMIAGIMEWRYPNAMGPRILFGRKSDEPAEKVYKKEVRTPSIIPSNPVPAVAGNPGPKPVSVVTGNPGPKSTSVITGNPYSTKVSVEKPTNEDEKILMRWARHIGADGQAYEQCIGCKKYTFIKAQKSGNTVVFTCPECNTHYKLNNG